MADPFGRIGQGGDPGWYMPGDERGEAIASLAFAAQYRRDLVEARAVLASLRGEDAAASLDESIAQASGALVEAALVIAETYREGAATPIAEIRGGASIALAPLD